jgi:hypothetical protein
MTGLICISVLQYTLVAYWWNITTPLTHQVIHLINSQSLTGTHCPPSKTEPLFTNHNQLPRLSYLIYLRSTRNNLQEVQYFSSWHHFFFFVKPKEFTFLREAQQHTKFGLFDNCKQYKLKVGNKHTYARQGRLHSTSSVDTNVQSAL